MAAGSRSTPRPVSARRSVSFSLASRNRCRKRLELLRPRSRKGKSMTKILIVEDEAGLRQGLEINLRLENYETAQAADGDEAIRLFHSEQPDLILLDLMLPKRSGFEVLDHIRKYSKVPVILLTARGQETDKVRGLRGGADDYVTKPFGLQELFARIDAVMRRSEATLAAKVVCEDDLIKLDPSTREASAKNQRLKLSPKEFDLLMYLFKNKERVVPRDELLSRVWNYRVDLNLNSRTVDTHVTRLRRKLQKALGTDAAVIVAVAKIGYRYLGEASNAA